MEEKMTKPTLLLLGVSLGTIVADIRALAADPAVPNLSGTYRCVPDARQCDSSIFSVSQSGRKLEVKTEQGKVGDGEVTSHLSISLGPPWNVLGTILPDQGTIQWSAGTKWQKQ